MPQAESKQKLSFTSWLKLKFLGKSKEVTPVDQRFLDDLSDIKSVGRYEIIGKLGQGSMGVVYLGRDPYINRNVSIKISRPASSVAGEGVEKYRERFFLEAQSAGKLLHPNIVAIYDAGMYRDFCYITMEYIDGPTLEKFCHKDSLLPVSKVIEIVFTACQALDFAHKKGVVHRDIKPSNIMLSRIGGVKITDFGIAQVKSEQTVSKGIIGSPCYMSPEQVKEQPGEDRSDIFSLGCVLYELLTGQKAFTGDNYFSILYKITNENPVPVREIRPEVPEILEKIVKKALTKDPNHRYQTCSDFAYDLRVALRALKGGPPRDKVESVIDYIHGVPFFENFSKDHVRQILNASNIIKVRKGKVLVSEGEIDDSFFIILSGKAAVHKNNKTIAFINRGECFGEMSYLSGGSRSATVVAETDCILLKISATLLDRSPDSIQLLFMKKFAVTLLQRLSKKIQEYA
ncbi:MAG: protein kinase [Deltaproteobacteria bacterium]|mgnify:CR=1 FL=1|nr:protein kinase [Deltaproteobacteria bacterium]MBW1919005.1 protein kinase [Deltaproteobacteria bacterium]MBW1935867.1 protein kinase [Deltaproteobacteria bacterium]MBW1978683.1 protein kinase [Deltaproteobacteria bacterium]MBW2044024.1 protein kinase [Deltaproteobacteria bacterium]